MGRRVGHMGQEAKLGGGGFDTAAQGRALGGNEQSVVVRQVIVLKVSCDELHPGVAAGPPPTSNTRHCSSFRNNGNSRFGVVRGPAAPAAWGAGRGGSMRVVDRIILSIKVDY